MSVMLREPRTITKSLADQLDDMATSFANRGDELSLLAADALRRQADKDKAARAEQARVVRRRLSRTALPGRGNSTASFRCTTTSAAGRCGWRFRGWTASFCSRQDSQRASDRMTSVSTADPAARDAW